LCKLNLSLGLQLEQEARRGIGISILFWKINSNGFKGLSSGPMMLSRLLKEFQGICGARDFARGVFKGFGNAG
jgi:hypothetical protein